MEEGSMAISTCNWHRVCAVAVDEIYTPGGWLPRQNRMRTYGFSIGKSQLAISLSTVAIIYNPCEVETRTFPSSSRTGRDGSRLYKNMVYKLDSIRTWNVLSNVYELDVHYPRFPSYNIHNHLYQHNGGVNVYLK